MEERRQSYSEVDLGRVEVFFSPAAVEPATDADFAGIESVVAIPISALRGENITEASAHTDWYHGPTLLGYLETVAIQSDVQALPLRFPVQWVNRPHQDFRGYAGTIASGVVAVGDKVRIQPSGRETTVSGIVTRDGDLIQAVAGQSVTLTLAHEVDASRGDLITSAQHPATVADQFQAHLVWMGDEPLYTGRHYLLQWRA